MPLNVVIGSCRFLESDALAARCIDAPSKFSSVDFGNLMREVNGARSRWEALEIGVAERINVEFEAPKITSISVHACSRRTSIEVAQIRE